MIEGASTEPLGIGLRQLVVPAGWDVLEVGAGFVTSAAPEGTVFAAGVAEHPSVADGTFASNVMLFRGHDGIDVDAPSLGPGQVWHDAVHEGPVQRIVIRFSEVLTLPVTAVHLWADVDGEAVLVVATFSTSRAGEVWPVVDAVIGSVIGEVSGWERWFR